MDRETKLPLADDIGWRPQFITVLGMIYLSNGPDFGKSRSRAVGLKLAHVPWCGGEKQTTPAIRLTPCSIMVMLC